MKPSNANEDHGQLFGSKYLEVLSHAHPLVSVATYLSVIGFLLAIAYQHGLLNPFGTSILIFVFAIFFWTFFEYLAHRYIFHLDHYFPKSDLAHRISYIFHGIHHEYPRDTSRLIMPPAPGILIILTLFFFGRFIMGNYIYLFLAGFLTGYLLYTFIHYKSHVTPIPPFLKSQYRHHALHHYKYQDKAFGVSSPFWDWVFGTLPPNK